MPRSQWHALVATAVAAVALVAVALALDGDGEGDGARGDRAEQPRACTLIACGSGVRVTLERVPAGAESARVCVDGECGEPQPVGGPVPLGGTLPADARRDGAVVRVSVRLLDGRGRPLAAVGGDTVVRRDRPNGPRCPPVCFHAALTVAVAPAAAGAPG